MAQQTAYFRNFLNDLSLDNTHQIPEAQVIGLVEDLVSTGTGPIVRQNNANIRLDGSVIVSGTIDPARFSISIPTPTGFYVQSGDPGGTQLSDVGKLWFDTTTTTTVVKVCKNIAGTITWVEI